MKPFVLLVLFGFLFSAQALAQIEQANVKIDGFF